jgi:hypothetical protein
MNIREGNGNLKIETMKRKKKEDKDFCFLFF